MIAIWTRNGRIVLALLGLALAVAPVVVAQLWIGYAVREQGRHEIRELAAETVDRADRTIDRATSTLLGLVAIGVSRCDAHDRGLMRGAVYSSYAIKEVGILSGDGRSLCTPSGSSLAIRTRSPSYGAHGRSVSLQAVELASGHAPAIMITKPLAKGGGSLAVVLASESIAQDLVPSLLRASAIGRMVFGDNRMTGTVSLSADTLANPASPAERIAVQVSSKSYPIAMHLSVPVTAVWHDHGALVAYSNVGAGFASLLVLGGFGYLIFGRSREIKELGAAVAREEFVPYYQPIVSLNSGQIVGCEVLMRWRKPDGTTLLPSEFIRLAEVTGLAAPMTRSMMHRVCDDLGVTYSQRRSMWLSINLFEAHFRTLRTVREVRDIFGRSGIRFDQLVFEVTEREPVKDIKRAQIVIRQLQALGARVALDDAGSGHAGLANLHSFGFDVIKIDKLFVGTVDRRGATAPIVDSLVKLGHDLHMEVIAEGVETIDQADYLRARGADFAQGFVFAPPLTGNAFRQLIEANVPPDAEEAKEAEPPRHVTGDDAQRPIVKVA